MPITDRQVEIRSELKTMVMVQRLDAFKKEEPQAKIIDTTSKLNGEAKQRKTGEDHINQQAAWYQKERAMYDSLT